MTEIIVKQPRSALSVYRDVIFTKRPGLKEGQSIPRIDARSTGMRIDMGRLKRYREVCGFGLSDQLPLTYLHIMAFPLHMEVLVHESFPLKAIGLVHIRNEITELKPVNTQMTLDCHVWVEGHREVEAGIEFDVHTEFSSGGELVWKGLMTTLRRGGSSEKSTAKKKRTAAKPLGKNLLIENWKVAENMGRRYAGVSGDRNPIHLYPFTAKTLGFKSHIVHGMWTKARTMAALEPMRPDGPVKLSVQFKVPIFLPAKVQLQALRTNNGCKFEVRDGNGEKPHMTGELTSV